jgi:hypothetical protein
MLSLFILYTGTVPYRYTVPAYCCVQKDEIDISTIQRPRGAIRKFSHPSFLQSNLSQTWIREKIIPSNPNSSHLVNISVCSAPNPLNELIIILKKQVYIFFSLLQQKSTNIKESKVYTQPKKDEYRYQHR